MKPLENTIAQPDVTRRDFIRGGSMAAMMSLLGGIELRAEDKPAEGAAATEVKRSSPPVNCGVIGCGVWGREVVTTLGKLPNAPVVAVCDTYEPMLKRAKDAAPNAEAFTDYKKLLEKKDCAAVIVATPSHLHRQIVLDALAAGKHVYCEAPLGSSMEDARAIAKAAKDTPKVNFQAGLQLHSDKQRYFVLQFVRSGAGGRVFKARAQWNKKQTWSKSSPNPEREKELNWRLQNASSSGLVGEVGIHQIDVVSWFMKELPTSVTGFGAIQSYKDGRDVMDTAQAIFEYPSGMTLNYDASLVNSYESEYEILFGEFAAFVLRGAKAWMFKESDAPLLGWEVYAKKDEFFKETGIVLRAGASKIADQASEAAGKENTGPTALQQALDAFVYNSDLIGSAVEDFAASFNINDKKALEKYLVSVKKNALHAATWQDGLEASVTAIKANEAVQKGIKIKFEPAWFEV